MRTTLSNSVNAAIAGNTKTGWAITTLAGKKLCANSKSPFTDTAAALNTTGADPDTHVHIAGPDGKAWYGPLGLMAPWAATVNG